MWPHEKTLRVKNLRSADVHKDVVRINWKDRGPVQQGQIVEVRVNGERRPLVVRGTADKETGEIQMDFLIADALKVDFDQSYPFEFHRVGPWGKVKWACQHSDPGIRIAVWLGIWLGGVGIVFSLLQILQPWWQPMLFR